MGCGGGLFSKMAASGVPRVAAAASTLVKPIFSRNMDEAKRRVRELYRAWYREVPNTGERRRRSRGPGGSCPRSRLTRPLEFSLAELQGKRVTRALVEPT